VLTLQRRGVGRVLRCTYADTELLVGHVVHPFLVVYVCPSDVGSDVSADGVTIAGGTMRIQLSAFITSRDRQPVESAPSLDLDVKWGLDEMNRLEYTVWDHPSVVSRLDTPGDLDSLRVTNQAIRSSLGRQEQAEIVDRIDGQKTSVRGLVDRRAQRRLWWIRRSHGTGRGDLSFDDGRQRRDDGEGRDEVGKHDEGQPSDESKVSK